MELQSIIHYLDSHRDALWFSIGFGLLALEAGVFGFSSGMLLFTGLAALVTGLLITVGLLSGAPTPAIALFAVTSLILAALFWKWFRRIHHGPTRPQAPVSDFVGLRFTLKQDVSLLENGVERYSGVDWRVLPDPSVGSRILPRGTQVEVSALDAGILYVRPLVP
ncbi:MAG: NfeD family protein [Magnetococcales bacterium]|nr:NfeD family protein [Magnetococcales bacterium]